MSRITTIKIYGERNTGTNYITRLLERNYDLRLLPGDVPRPFWNKRAIGLLRRIHRPWGLIVNNRTADAWFLNNFNGSLGWKHSLPPVDRIAQIAGPDLGIVGLTKNPYSWLLSMYRRPYQNFAPAESFEAFVTAPYPTVPRELMTEQGLTPVQLWCAKARGYLALQKALPQQVAVLRYEDFLADEDAVLSRLETDWSLAPKGARQQVSESAKGDKQGYSDYQRYYLEEEWRAKLSDEAVQAITAQLDPDVMAAIGYKALTP
ncbi:MAG: hypothetical protein N4A53_14525 [Pelagimonas sp.]|jgi:hypothetical protein|nr:hypothetical protein [Pelagimonas sp.]